METKDIVMVLALIVAVAVVGYVAYIVLGVALKLAFWILPWAIFGAIVIYGLAKVYDMRRNQ